MTAEVHGHVEPGFEGVRDAFGANFADGGEIGAAFSLFVEGTKVVDVWGGVADPSDGRAWDADTLVLVFSTTKGAAAVCANVLMDRGILDPDEKVATYWPEFAAHGKGGLTVRQLLSHQAGVPVIDEELTFADVAAWEPVAAALARHEPLWEPGTAHGYHAVTFGWLVGELVRRTDGRSLGRFFADEVAARLDLDFTIGTPADRHHRVAKLRGAFSGSGGDGSSSGGGGGLDSLLDALDPEVRELARSFIGPDSLTGRALTTPSGVLSDGGGYNRPEVWELEVPAANGITDARSLAKMYAALVGEVDGVRLLTPEQMEAARTRQIRGNDQVLFFKSRFGLGFMLSSVFSPYGNERSFGHAGLGGSVGFADPDHQLGFGYVMNRLSLELNGDERSRRLVAACYDAIGVEPDFT